MGTTNQKRHNLVTAQPTRMGVDEKTGRAMDFQGDQHVGTIAGEDTSTIEPIAGVSRGELEARYFSGVVVVGKPAKQSGGDSKGKGNSAGNDQADEPGQQQASA